MKFILKWLAALFRRSQKAEPSPSKAPRSQSSKSTREELGALYFRSDLLDRLDDYFADLKLMRSHDQDAYDLYTQVGGQVATSRSKVYENKLEPFWLATRPGFGLACVANSAKDAKDKGDNIYISMAYYQKMELPAGVQAMPNSDTYNTTVVYVDRKAKHQKPVMMDFFVAVDRCTGNLTPLRQKKIMHGPIPTRYWGKSRTLSFIGEEWGKTSKEVADYLFIHTANLIATSAAGIQVRVTRGDLTACFNIDMLRTPYFFDDRTKVKGPTGFTKKIFHITRAHERFSRAGKRSVVKTHFRGLRRFNWNGYSVVISVPDLHHPDAKSFDVASVNVAQYPGQKMLTARQTGRMISEVMQ